jgi:hypothetical protein
VPQPSWTLTTEKIRTNGGRTVDAVPVGPLAVNLGVSGYVVTHVASGAFVGRVWPSCAAAIAAAGALLTIPSIDWDSERPVTNGQERLVRSTLATLAEVLG